MHRRAIAAILTLGLLAGCSSRRPIDKSQLDERVDLLAMGDWGTNGERQKRTAGAMRDYVSASGARVDAMLLAGDNFYTQLTGTSDPQWQEMFERMYDPAILNFPFYASLGNHDYPNGKYRIELDYAKENPQSRWKMPARWYRVDLPKANASTGKPLVTVLMLDSNMALLTPEEWRAERRWMKSQLSSKQNAPWVICCAHHPFFSNGDHGDNGVLQAEWGGLFQRYHVDFYVCGHDHDIQHLEVAHWPMSFLLVGGGGAATRPIRVDQRGPFAHAANGFAHLSFQGNVATIRLIDREVKVIHEFSRDLNGNVTSLHSEPTDVATPRTIQSVTRGGEESTTQSATLPATFPGTLPVTFPTTSPAPKSTDSEK